MLMMSTKLSVNAVCRSRIVGYVGVSQTYIEIAEDEECLNNLVVVGDLSQNRLLLITKKGFQDHILACGKRCRNNAAYCAQLAKTWKHGIKRVFI